MIAGLSKDNYEPPKSSRLVPAIRHKGTYKELQGTSRNFKELQGTTRNHKEPTRNHKELQGTTRNFKELQGTSRNLQDIICPLLTRLAPQAPPVLRSS